jgi:hypothetical protein
MEILFETEDFFVYQAESWELQAFEGDTFIVASDVDGEVDVIAEFETLEEAEECAYELQEELENDVY